MNLCFQLCLYFLCKCFTFSLIIYLYYGSSFCVQLTLWLRLSSWTTRRYYVDVHFFIFVLANFVSMYLYMTLCISIFTSVYPFTNPYVQYTSANICPLSCICGVHVCVWLCGLFISKLTWAYISGCNWYISCLLPSPVNVTGLPLAETPSALASVLPSPARTTAFPPTSISERDNGSSEATTPLSAGKSSSQASLQGCGPHWCSGEDRATQHGKVLHPSGFRVHLSFAKRKQSDRKASL